jgi:hypothetical protein
MSGLWSCARHGLPRGLSVTGGRRESGLQRYRIRVGGVPWPRPASMASGTGEMMATVRPGEADAVAGRVARLGAGTVVARPRGT